MKRFFCLLLLILTTVFSLTGCETDVNNAYDMRKYDEIKMKDFRQQINEAKNEELSIDLPNGMTIEKLAYDLLKHKKFIPFKGVLGGTPSYNKKSIFFFDNYVFIRAEDGHIGADMVLSYTVTKMRNIKWTLLAYDKGEFEDSWE